MYIVDSQVHVWISGRQVTPGNAHHRQAAAFSADDLLTEMDSAGVARAVLVPPVWGNNDHPLQAAQRVPERFAVMGRLNLAAPESRGQLAKWKQQPGMLGLRAVFNIEHAALLTEGKVDWLWSEAEEADVPLMVLAPGLLHLIEEAARRHPGLRLTIDHLGVGRNAKGEGAFAHIPQLAELARYPNLSVKASGLPGYSTESYPFRDLQPYIRRVFDAFGPLRVFWGTDLTRMAIPYRQCVTHFTEEIPWLSEKDKELIMGRALCDWLGWTLPAV